MRERRIRGGRAASYAAPVEDAILDGEDGDAGEVFGGPGFCEGEGGCEGAAQVGAVDGYGTRAAIRCVLDDVFNNPAVGVEGIVDGGGK